jgi:hypothetical protein
MLLPCAHPVLPYERHHDRKAGVVGMGGQTLLRIRFVVWMLLYLFLFVVIGVDGSVIVYLLPG